MKFVLTNAYSLCIIISPELTDVSCHTTNLKEVDVVEMIMLLLATYYQNIIAIFMILMSVKNRA